MLRVSRELFKSSEDGTWVFMVDFSRLCLGEAKISWKSFHFSDIILLMVLSVI